MLGSIIYDSSEKNINNKILDTYDEYLSEYSYDKIWIELSSIEQEILLSFNTNDSIEVKDLVKKINKTNQYIGVYRDKLIKKEIIFVPSFGKLQFSLPRFNEFLDVKREYY